MALPKIPKPAPIPKITQVRIPHVPSTPIALTKPPKVGNIPKAVAPKTHLPWLGNKSGTPRPPGARIQSHLKELEGSEYPTVKW